MPFYGIGTCRFGIKSVEAELRPRFPLYGGWKTEFTFGYSLPLKAVMTKKKGIVQLEALFGSPFDNVVVEDLTVKVWRADNQIYFLDLACNGFSPGCVKANLAACVQSAQ